MMSRGAAKRTIAEMRKRRRDIKTVILCDPFNDGLFGGDARRRACVLMYSMKKD